MTVSELTPAYIASWLGYASEGEEVDADTIREISLALSGAKAKATGYTGLTLDELDEYEDITIAVLGLCNDFLVNNRPESADRVMNRMSEDILAMHCKNFL